MAAYDEGLLALNKTLDRLQDELMQVGRKRPDIAILKDIDTVERLIDEHEIADSMRDPG